MRVFQKNIILSVEFSRLSAFHHTVSKKNYMKYIFINIFHRFTSIQTRHFFYRKKILENFSKREKFQWNCKLVIRKKGKMTKRSWGYHEFSSKVKESKIFSNKILRNNYKIKITSWTSSFWLMTPKFPHPLSSTQQFDTTGPLFFSPENPSAQHKESLISTHPSLQHQKPFSSTHPSVPHWGVCWTDWFLMLNWGMCWTEGVLNWECVDLRACWTDGFLVLNWGVCWTEGVLNWRVFDVELTIFNIQLRDVLNWVCVHLRVCWTESVLNWRFLMLNWGVCWTDGIWVLKRCCPCVELMCWNERVYV